MRRATLLVVGLVEAKLGQLLELRVGAVDVHPVVGLACRLQHRPGDPLRGLSPVVAGEHAVDVGLVEGPDATAQVQAQDVHRRNEDDALGETLARPLTGGNPGQKVGQAGQYEHAVQLVSVYAGDEGSARGLVGRAQVVVGDVEVLAQRRGHLQEQRWVHGLCSWPPASTMRAMSEPS